MKLTLFMIALVAVSFGAQAQGQNAFYFRHIINGKKFKSYKIAKLQARDQRKCNRCIARNATRSNPKTCEACTRNRSETPGLILQYAVDTAYANGRNLLPWGNDVCSPANDTLPVIYQYPVTYRFTSIGNLYLLDTILMPQKKFKCNLSIVNNGVAVDFFPMDGPPLTGYVSSSTPINPPQKFILPLRPRSILRDKNRYAQVSFRSLALGLTVGTFRYRPKQDTVSGGNIPGTIASALTININFGYAFGFSRINTKRMTNYSAVIGGFVGFSPVKLDNTVVKDPSKWRKPADDRTNPAISYGANLILSRNNFGVVFSLGFDSNIGPRSKEWVYQNKPWVGIGLNASLGIF